MFRYPDGTFCHNSRPGGTSLCVDHQPVGEGRCGQPTGNGTRCRNWRGRCPIHRPPEPQPEPQPESQPEPQAGPYHGLRSSQPTLDVRNVEQALCTPRQGCTAHNSRGRPCRFFALPGTTRCRNHPAGHERSLPAYLRISPSASNDAASAQGFVPPPRVVAEERIVVEESWHVSPDDALSQGVVASPFPAADEEIVVEESAHVSSDDEIVEIAPRMEGGGPFSNASLSDRESDGERQSRVPVTNSDEDNDLERQEAMSRASLSDIDSDIAQE